MVKATILLVFLGFFISCEKDPSLSKINELHKQGWILTFNDEFNDSTLNYSKWRPHYRWGNGVYNAACYQKENVRFENGYALLTAKREDGRCGSFVAGSTAVFDNQYSSGMICSSECFQQRYGYFEIRCKTPRGNGLWPAFWLMSLVSWPPEIDIAEFQGSNTRKLNLAYSYLEPHDGDAEKFNVSDCSEGFHTYAVEWNNDGIVWYYDGIVLKRAIRNIPDVPMYVIANLQVNESGFAGYVDSNTAFPASFIIDYIRVYKKLE